jgi:hypothetical protein
MADSALSCRDTRFFSMDRLVSFSKLFLTFRCLDFFGRSSLSFDVLSLEDGSSVSVLS